MRPTKTPAAVAHAGQAHAMSNMICLIVVQFATKASKNYTDDQTTP
ncbi:hypothetical protein SKA53_06852 [Yoonia vestfoldensis SKA53]|uniref:Uncharacterized protein n=1 Tax=Yoonia vestfoldensis SKA53 TaxID=314232 RepID=A3V803_9RHOB|nr:hypothetical protein SKA53_06852 [Yoonia vestfoldensis SKA53]